MRRTFLSISLTLALVLTAGLALASAKLHNADSRTHKLLVSTSESCFSGTHTSIGSNTTTDIPAGWVCVDEKKPAVKVKDGKQYVIKNGELKEK